MNAPKYGIIGTGAVGGFYGAKLVTAGCDVHFLARSDFNVIRRRGLKLTSGQNTITIPVKVYDRVRDIPRCDAVLVTLKTTKNYLLPRLLRPVVKRGGLIVLLQNGIGWEEKVASRFPRNHVAAGLAFLCSTKIAPGHIHHLDYGGLTLAPYARSKRKVEAPAILKRVAQDFRRAGIPTRILPDIVLARWKKLMWNIPFNGLSVVHNTTTDKLVSNPVWRGEVKALMAEVSQGARAMGCRIPPSFMQKMMRDTERMKPYRTSMKVDFDAKRPMEIEAIFGNPLRMARAAGVHLPGVAELYRTLKQINCDLAKTKHIGR